MKKVMENVPNLTICESYLLFKIYDILLVNQMYLIGSLYNV